MFDVLVTVGWAVKSCSTKGTIRFTGCDVCGTVAGGVEVGGTVVDVDGTVDEVDGTGMSVSSSSFSLLSLDSL